MNQIFEIDGITYTIETENKGEVSLKKKGEVDGISTMTLDVKFGEATLPKLMTITYEVPCVDMYTMWDPLSKKRDLDASWRKNSGRTASALASGMPLKGVCSKQGVNRYLIALSDVKTPLVIKMGASHYRGAMLIRLEMFTRLCGPFTEYTTDIRIDTRAIPFDGAILEAREWYSAIGYPPAYSPEYSKVPVYSTWYSFLQTVSAKDVLRECRAAVKYGMKTVIIDDGWQTDVSTAFYGYCGDWKPTKKKFPDMRGLVDQLHELGMKVMLWFPVPYMGIFSENYKRFEGYYLTEPSASNCVVMDPRYKLVRDFMTDTYVNAVKDWNLDGLKLDFIDRFVTNGIVKDGMDFVSVEEAVEQLLREIHDRLTEINPDILLEFRQPYYGPVVGAYSNMMRVWDCPEDGVTNKTQSLNLRLISSTCAVHSDMMYWNPQDTKESVGTQLWGTVFSVPQISTRDREITKEQKQILRRYLNFWIEHKDTLCNGALHTTFAENGYGLASAELNGEMIAISSTEYILDMPKHIESAYFINITDRCELVLRSDEKVSYEILDCTGKRLGRARTTRGRLTEVNIPLAGMLKVVKG